MFTAHGGNVIEVAESLGLSPDEILDFSVNLNPLGPPPQVREALLAEVSELNGVRGIARYPDPHCRALRRRLGEQFDLAPDRIIVGAGATELLYLIPRALRPRRILVLAPCYQDYWLASAEADVEGLMASEEDDFVHKADILRERSQMADMIFMGNPNSPTGSLMAREDIILLAAHAPHTLFVVDETFNEFLPQPADYSLLATKLPENVVVVRSLSKFFAIPGLRLGFAVGTPEIVRRLERVKEPWTVNAVALRVGEKLYEDADYMARTRALVAEQRTFLRLELERITGLHLVPGAANFFLICLKRRGLASGELKQRMLRQKVLIRDCANIRGLDSRYVRVAVRSEPENKLLVGAFRTALEEKSNAEA